MYKKILFERTLLQPAWSSGRNTVEIWTAAPLAYLLMSLEVIGSEEISLTDLQSLKTVS